jgi:hypothetical protein
MHRVVLLACTLGLVLAPSVSGQKGKPNFSGTWVPVSGGPEDAETITQDATTLTMAHPSEAGAHTMRYRLDGSETRNSVAGMVIISKASWDGDKLRNSPRLTSKRV